MKHRVPLPVSLQLKSTQWAVYKSSQRLSLLVITEVSVCTKVQRDILLHEFSRDKTKML